MLQEAHGITYYDGHYSLNHFWFFFRKMPIDLDAFSLFKSVMCEESSVESSDFYYILPENKQINIQSNKPKRHSCKRVQPWLEGVRRSPVHRRKTRKRAQQSYKRLSVKRRLKSGKQARDPNHPLGKPQKIAF